MEHQTTHPERILLVEPDPEVRAHLGSDLARAGHVVESAADGDQAVELLGRFAPTAVVADMEARVGPTPFVDVVRSRPEGEGVPILVLGDSSHIEEFQRMLQLGRVWYIARRAEWPQFERTFDTMRRRAEADIGL